MAKKTETRLPILSDAEIRSKIRRMTWEIFESNFDSKKITIMGLGVQGGFLAKEIAGELEKISSIKVDFIQSDKDTARSQVTLEKSVQGKIFKDRNVVIVDDVLYSGKTLFNAVATVLVYGPQRVQTAILIDRGHRLLPIWPNFTGLELATTLREHVTVDINLKTAKAAAYLE